MSTREEIWKRRYETDEVLRKARGIRGMLAPTTPGGVKMATVFAAAIVETYGSAKDEELEGIRKVVMELAEVFSKEKP